MEEILQRFGAGRLLTMAGIGLGLMAFFGFIMMRANQPEMSLLYGQIEAAEGGRVIEKLKSMGIPFEVKGDGSQIYAPAGDISRLRMELAQDGMPSGGGVGYEIFDKQDILGTTNALLSINQIRALEGELGKSIRTIQGIQAARVHLVIPKRELFSENKQEPSASVMVRMKGLTNLSATQVQSIRYLVSSAVPGLLLDQVSIVDDRGNLLARGKDSKESKDSLIMQQTAQREYEQRISKSIEALLDRTLGLNKTRVEVSVDMDFDQVSSTSVQYDPEGQVVKSQTTNEEGVTAHETSGSEGVSVQAALPAGQDNPSSSGNQNHNQTSNTEENVNYEISNTTKTYVKELGAIKRLSIAVMVDGTYKKKDDGTQEYQPRSEEEITKLKELVKTATGFKEDRGDVISLVNLKFSEIPQDAIPEEKDKPFLGLNMNKLIELGITALVVLIGLFTVVKPIVSSLTRSSQSKYSANLTQQMLSSVANAAPGEMPIGMNVAQAQYAFKNPVPTAPVTLPPTAIAILQKSPEEIVRLSKEEPNNPDLQLIRNSGLMPKLDQSTINLDRIENLAQQSSTRKIAELIDRHPEEALSIIRTWMYSDK